MDDLKELRKKMKVTRVAAEDPDAVRDHDDAHVDGLYYKDGRRMGDPGTAGAHHVFGSTEGMTSDGGAPPRRRVRK